MYVVCCVVFVVYVVIVLRWCVCPPFSSFSFSFSFPCSFCLVGSFSLRLPWFLLIFFQKTQTPDQRRASQKFQKNNRMGLGTSNNNEMRHREEYPNHVVKSVAIPSRLCWSAQVETVSRGIEPRFAINPDPIEILVSVGGHCCQKETKLRVRRGKRQHTKGVLPMSKWTMPRSRAWFVASLKQEWILVSEESKETEVDNDTHQQMRIVL